MVNSAPMTVMRKTARAMRKFPMRLPRTLDGTPTPWEARCGSGHGAWSTAKTHGTVPQKVQSGRQACPLDAATFQWPDYHTVGRKFGPGISLFRGSGGCGQKERPD